MKKQSAWSILENNPFIEGLFEWMDSAQGQRSDEVRELVWQSLKNVDVDASHRKLIWDDGKRLSIAESVQRIHQNYAQFPLDLIETHLIGWLEMGFAPESYSQAQLDDLDRLIEEWIDDHNGQRRWGDSR
ncbi:MAG: hypothetical protein FJW38_29410 [Acidobacteria bacterium]|nr:hypothetical protein [Acidobacteriota bacterium]